MTSTPLMILATSPDGERFAAVGPVYSEQAALKLAEDIAAAGWKPDGVRRRMSAGAFREMAGKEKAGG